MHLDWVTFNGNSTFTFKVHVIQNLSFHISFRQGMRHFKQSIRKRRLAVIDMGDYTKVSFMAKFHDGKLTCLRNLEQIDL
tara:strand:- start:828 stop:1067 length:240 start_codon:yes stop_codon:yes gene_type:complete